MFRHTITRVRPSVDIIWRGEFGGLSNNHVEYNFEGLDVENYISEDGLTKTSVRTADNAEVFALIESNLSNTSHEAYKITRYCNNAGIVTTFTLEEI